MKAAIMRVLEKAAFALPGKKYILFESAPFFSDNTRPVYQEMRRRGWERRFRLVWYVTDPGDLRAGREKGIPVFYVDSRWKKHRFFWMRLRAAAILDCNDQIRKRNPRTLHLYLTHGSPMKRISPYYFCDDTTDYVLCQAPFFENIDMEEFRVRREQLVTLGFPRNDALFTGKKDLSALFGVYDKYVAWYPTYRQHRNHQVSTTDISIPLLHDPEQAEAINTLAVRNNILLLVKPHPAQDVANIQKLELSHIRWITEADLEGLPAYEFLASVDGLITDYSSVVFDFLLTDRPIGLTFEDFAAYSEHPGFAMDTDILRNCCEMLDTAGDFDAFFAQVLGRAEGPKKERETLKRTTNQFQDAGSTKRVVDFVAQKLNIQEENHESNGGDQWRRGFQCGGISAQETGI